MVESAQVAAKTQKATRENSASKIRKIDSSQPVNPLESPVDQVLYLQRTIGNQAVQRLIKSGALQAKLKIGQPGDMYEQEADRVADAVMRMPEPGVQRQVDEEEEEEETLQTKTLANQITPLVQVQRQEEPEEEEEELQAKSTSGHLSEVNSNLESHILSLKGGGQPLPESERTFFEPRFGHDFRHVRVHTDAKAAESARAVNARAFTVGRDVVFGEDQYQPQTNQGKQLLGHELTHIIQQNGVFSQSVIQRKPPTQSAKKAGVTFWYSVEIHSELTSDQLMLEFIKQYYKIKSDEKAKEIRQKGNWHWTKAPLVPTKNDLKKGYILIKVMDLSLSASDTKSQQERKEYFGKFTPEEKDRLNAEVDRQFWDKTHYKVGEKLGDSADDQKMAKYWMALHDEMIRKRQVIEAFPPHIQKFLFDEKAFATLEPKDFDAVLRIASKIAALTPAKLRDYKSRVTAKTTNWSVFELSVDKYIAEMAERAKKGEEHEKIQTKLIGLEEVYKNYKLYKSLLMSGSMGAVSGRYGPGAGAGIAISLQAEKVRKELETQLKKHGFAGITEFEAYIKKFEQAFEQEAANIANDLLEKYAGKLYRESERYKNPTEIAALHRKLGGVRTQYGEFEKNKKILKDYVKAARARERSRIPGQGHLRTRGYTSTTSGEAEAARKKAEEAKASAKSQVKGMSGEHPIFQEEGLPLDKRIDKAALAKASESELGGLLQGHIQNRMKDIGEARAEIHKKPEVIYKMEKLLPVFYAKQGIRPGSIHDMIIRDKMRSDAILKLVKGIAVAIVAIALAVLTFGKAIPVIIAVAAGIAGAGLGVYMAYDEYLEYTQEKNLADVGFAKDPSVVWLVIAVLGAAFDMASAVKAVSALGKAAKALDVGGDLKAFTKVVRQQESMKTITAEIARAAENAAVARKGFAEASAELTKAMTGKVYSFPGPLADSKVYRAVVKMARQAIKTKVYDAQKFIEELKLARVKAKLGDLTPEELAKAKQAWEEAKVLEAAEQAVEVTERSRVGSYTTRIRWGIQEVDARPHTSIKEAFWGRRVPQKNPRVDAYELKINPNNESFFLPHPSGGYVQFEHLVGTSLVQDGKLVMSPRSLYHIADMPPFARQKVLAEARRQVAAASTAGLRVEWLISDARAMQQLDALFQTEGITITLRLLPE